VLKPEAILVRNSQKGFDHVRWFSQAKFATLLRVEVSTLRNWEQGRRESTGPAKALLYAIRKTQFTFSRRSPPGTEETLGRLIADAWTNQFTEVAIDLAPP
jgi:transcriptional regulator with XRE-family HTH domain